MTRSAGAPSLGVAPWAPPADVAGLPDCACGEPSEPLPDCIKCGDPRDPVPTCPRCAYTTWRGLCSVCNGNCAEAELAGLPARLRAVVEAWEPAPVENQWGHDPRARSVDPRREWRLQQLERAELRDMWLERAAAEAHLAALDVERLEGDKHEGWAYDQGRGADGKPLRGVDAKPLTAMGHIERLTRPHRLHKAADHKKRMQGARAQGRRLRRVAESLPRMHPELVAEIPAMLDAADACDVLAAWHRGRARGQRERFHELAHCGEGVADVRCRNCEPQNLRDGGQRGRRVRPIGCSVTRACVACRDRRANLRRPVFWRARDDVRRQYRQLGLFRHKRHGGRWSEKDFTLTIPDALIQGERVVERRHELVLEAWKHFRKLMSRHWRSAECVAADPALRRGTPVAWHAAFETTPGADGLGHPHWHVWMISPWVRQDDIMRWWAMALRRCGLDVDATDLIKPVLREVRCQSIVSEVFKGRHRIRVEPKDPLPRVSVGRPHHATYIEGWTISTRGKHGRPGMSANVQGRLYMVLEGVRSVRCSRGFLQRGARSNVCPCCGVDSVVLNSATGECVPALEASVRTWRSALMTGRGPPLARGSPAQPLKEQKHGLRA